MTEFKLNPQQEQAFTELADFTDVYVLKGYAGTGKTTVITRWVQAMRKRPDDAESRQFWRAPSIVLTAPTNKATGVLKKMADEIKLPVDVSTIHSLLSLKMQWQKDKQVLVQDKYGDDTFGAYDYVVIDECSMLDQELMKYIRAAQERNGNKIVFMGDPCQLPPIGEPGSESFESSLEMMELTQVMRQKEGNPIADLALYLRELILERPKTYPDILQFVDNKSILHLPVAAQEHNILDAFARAEDEGLDIRHVAWTNKVVDTWNDQIRNRIYGFDREDWTKGEMIVTTAPVMQGSGFEKQVKFTTDTLLTINSEPKLTEHLGIPCWKFMCRGVPMRVVEKSTKTRQLFNAEKDKLIAAAKQDRKKWRFFYDFMEAFAQVKPAHSLTVHRSQGSTFDDVYVSWQNILANPNRKESLQCLYVACTRPRSRLILV